VADWSQRVVLRRRRFVQHDEGAQVTADFACPKASSEFSLTVPSGYRITGGQATNRASSGYTCSLNSTMNTVEFTTSPNPQAGMKLQLNVSSNGSFTLTTQ
jgi:hypothetical protein